jgi:quercetin dioxygenase-like cupin family protein
MKNILSELQFSIAKPAVYKIRSSDSILLMAIGLLKEQVLKEHKANVPSFLTVLKGSISFQMEDDTHVFNSLDTFQIPLDKLHKVVGLDDENVFLVLQEK